MPYINEQNRPALDKYAQDIGFYFRCTMEKICLETDPSDVQFMKVLGDLNYLFSNIIMRTSGELNYNKIAMITGVLENIKQEFYRRAASSYEDKKIDQNGDISVYKQFRRV